MSNTKNSFSSLIAQFLRLQKNSLEIINKLNDVTTSPKDTVEVEIVNDDNTSGKIQVPSIGFLKSEINRIDQNIIALSGLENNTANIRKADGTIAKIYQASVLKDPQSPTSLAVPSTFQARNNWFFESFLNPLLYVSINVDNQIPDGSNKVITKRIIANTQTDTHKQYFDTNIKGRNDLTDTNYISVLKSQGIQYFVDEQVVDLELRSIRYKGNFGVLNIFDESTQVTEAGVTTNTTIRKYKLSTLKYTDNLSTSTNTRTLTKGDQLLTSGGTKYEITSIDTTTTTIVLKRLFGFDPVKIGANSLSIYSNTLSPRTVDVNVGFDERQGVFIKSIDEDFNIASSSFSPGICFWSNELQINTSDGIKTLEGFYNSEVSDFGRIFIAGAKEKTIPSIYGITPAAPVLTVDNFNVVPVNGQITDSKQGKDFKTQVQSKTTLKNEIAAIDKAIDQTRKQLADLTTTSVGKTPTAEFKKLSDNIVTLTKDKANKTQLLSTTISTLNNLISTTPELVEAPKYRVRGFFPIPNPASDPKTGEQNIVQFNIRYRYLSLAGNATGTEKMDYIDNDGTKKSGQFSNWNPLKSDIRKKQYDVSKGFYVWKKEDPTDPDATNINQIDLPMTKGEKIEIQVQSISEAGWPTNPIVSDWSQSVVIEFPASLSSQIDNSSFIAQNNNDKVIVEIQSDLQAKGLDQHLSGSYQAGEKYVAHGPTQISSGFFDTAGKSLDVFQKLTQIDNELQTLKALIAKAKGTLAVFIRTSDGTRNKVTNGSTVQLNAGYYDNLIDLGNPTNKGKIATVNYAIELNNEAATTLELSSLIPGGQSVQAPLNIAGKDDYNNNRKYAKTPVQLTSEGSPAITTTSVPGYFKQKPGFQSANAYSQFIYPRYKSVGLDQNLYFSPNSTYVPTATSPIRNNGILLPIPPASGSGGANSNIWNDSYNSGVPNGGGGLNEFCIHLSHPDLNDGNSKLFSALTKPTITVGGIMQYPSFRHSLGFELDTNTSQSAFGSYTGPASAILSPQISNLQQLEYSPSTNAAFTGIDTDYPNKLGFVDSDEYLCGKYSCGAYLYFAPTSHVNVQVEGTTQMAKKDLVFGTQNSITVPIIFQMRAQDKLGYIGGFRTAGALKNVTYTKKIGIDIQVKNEELFSFDISVTGSYTKDSVISPSYSQGRIADNYTI
jgi:hypothetical protein